MTSTRQRIWNLLRKKRKTLTRIDIAEEINADRDTVSRYLNALKKSGYVEHDEAIPARAGNWKLIRNTGPIAPKINSRGGGRDYNLDPSMTGEELKRIIDASGLSLRGWAKENGLSGNLSTRLRQMINGQRPIGRTIEAAARNHRD